MRLWRRLLTGLLLLVFAPSSVFAAMPVVWCVGSDGHRAVEYSLRDSGRHADHQPVAQLLSDESRGVHPSAEVDCRHWLLLGKAKVSSQQAHDGLLTFDVRVVVVLPSPPLDEWLCVSSSSPLVGFTNCRPPDPQRLALRSIVLRI